MSDVYKTANDQPLASLTDRFLAALIDGLIVGVPVFILACVMSMVLGFMGIAGDSYLGRIVSLTIGLGAGIGVFLAVNGKSLAEKGQTFGKSIIKTAIVSEDGSLIPLQELIKKRYLPIWLVSLVPVIGPLL
jgi:uncharacterized RDD family membrane protein YckC